MELFSQIETLKLEINRLRGQIEVLNNNIETTARRQRDMYQDIDTRLRRIETTGSAAPAVVAPGPGGYTYEAAPYNGALYDALGRTFRAGIRFKM